MSSGNKYHREVRSIVAPTNYVTIDVYSVLTAYEVSHPAIAHAVKKLLLAGQRGQKSRLTDLREARDALSRAIEDAEAEGG